MRAEIFSPEGEAHTVHGDDEFDDLPEEVNDETFPDLVLAPEVCEHAAITWELFLDHYPSHRMAGEAIFTSIFDANPSLQVLFKSPASVMALKFVSAFGGVLEHAGDPAALKPLVETLGFQHMDFDINRQKIQSFRDAIVDLLDMDLGNTMTSKGKYGIAALINYIGGACMYIRKEYTSRVQMIHTTWAQATHAGQTQDDEEKQETKARPSVAEEAGEENAENVQVTQGAGEATGDAPPSVPTGFFDAWTKYIEVPHHDPDLLGWAVSGILDSSPFEAIQIPGEGNTAQGEL